MKTKYTIVFVLLFFLSLTLMQAQTRIIAHRGYWDCEGSAQNSIASLRNAQKLGIYGSEFDVLLTFDGIPVVHHDNDIDGKKIEDTPYDEIKNLRLKNGEVLPTLEAYLEQGKKDTTRLILEIKSHSTKEKEDRAVAVVVEMVENAGLEDRVEYISFSLNICKELVVRTPGSSIAYLEGDKSPEELKELGITGIDYSLRTIRKQKRWIADAHHLGMTVNVWTIRNEEEKQEMIKLGVDFITTDCPE